jgi:outer membrane protein TolC
MNLARLCGLCLTAAVGAGLAVAGGAPSETPEPLPTPLSLPAAVTWALVNNPELATIRAQHNLAAADVVIAHTYPFNPLSENRIQHNDGPESAGITSRVALENLLLWEVEVRGQSGYRRQTAGAALSRVGWEIAGQEQAAAVRVTRAFQTLVYRREKLRLLEEVRQLNARLVDTVRRLQEAGRLRGADLLVAQTEADSAAAARGQGLTALTDAESDLRRALGIVAGSVDPVGGLETNLPPWDVAILTEDALNRRPELHAREAALAEAEARLNLETANRYGNPTIGTAYTYDPTRVNLIGGQIKFPIPVANTHRGEILLREAERNRSALELRQTEVAIRQDVQAAADRLAAALALAATYRTQVLPNLEKALKGLQELFGQADPGVDLLRVIDVQRKRIQGRDAYLDALFAVRQALTDLAAAVGDPSLAICPPSP